MDRQSLPNAHWSCLHMFNIHMPRRLTFFLRMKVAHSLSRTRGCAAGRIVKRGRTGRRAAPHPQSRSAQEVPDTSKQQADPLPDPTKISSTALPPCPSSTELLSQAMIAAAVLSNTQQVKRLLQHGANVNFQQQGTGRTALSQACQSGCADTARILLDSGADCYLYDDDAVSPLILACRAGYQEIAEILLVRGEADAYQCSSSGRTALLEAASEGHTECMSALIELGGADVNYVSEPGGENALLLAAAGGHLAALKLLLQKGAKVNRTDACGITALHAAARQGDVRMVQVLLQHRAKCITEFKNKHTPLHQAAAAGHTAVVKLLLESKVADASVLDSCMKTAAQLAIHHNTKVMFEQYAVKGTA